MASYHLIQHVKPRVDSPAKIFAKLKSKVQREEMSREKTNNAAIDPLYTEQRASSLMSPKKRPARTHVNNDFKENQRFGPYRNEAQVCTLSPIPSPQKTCTDSYLDNSSKPWADYSPRKRAFMESTAMSQPLCLYNRPTRIHSEPPGHLDEFMVTSSRTPVKMQREEGECRTAAKGKNAPLDGHKFPASVYSPMRKRLRKASLESRDFNKFSRCTNKVSDGVSRTSWGRKASSAVSEDGTDSYTSMDDLRNVRGSTGDQPGMNQFPHEPMLLPRYTASKRCQIGKEIFPPMSPAKMFAYMKQRESKAEQQDAHEVSSSTRDLFDNRNSRPPKDTHPTTGLNVDLIQAQRDQQDSVAPVDKSREESADSQSDTDPSEGTQILAEPSQPVLFEDPLVLNTPRVAIPKKLPAVFKRNKWPQLSKFPSESVVYLKKWFLRMNHKGLFVDGIHRDENLPWNSNIIVDRVSKCALKTVSGRVYILVGKMNLKVDSEFPNWLLKKFVNGFPVNWKALYEKFLSEKDRETAKDGEKKSVKSKPKSGASSVNHSEKQHKQKPLRTPASCPPVPSNSKQVSRSGRTIKPPLEYWKGGRVILDANMNVTIHECYQPSICIPEVTTTVSSKKSKNSAPVFLSSDEGNDGCGSTTDQEEPTPPRGVKPQLPKSNRAKVSSKGKPSPPLESPVKTRSSRGAGSRRTSSSNRRNASTKQTEPEKSSKSSKKQTHKPPTPPLRVSKRKQAVSSPPECSAFSDLSQSSDDEVFCRRVKKEKAIRKTKGGGVVNKRKSSLRFPSSESSEESPEDIKRRTRVTRTRGTTQAQRKPKECKSTKISPPTKPLPKATQPSKKEKAKNSNTLTLQDEDGDEWTETELQKLQEAVSYFPKHMDGYWAKVARMVGTHSPEECYRQHSSQGNSHTPASKSSKSRKQRVEAPKDLVPDLPLISARAGTLRRKQEVRQFLEAMPKEDVEDIFTSAYMHKKRSKIPTICSIEDQDFALSVMEPQTPGSTTFPEVKTPRCLQITPGMIGSPNRTNDDKYVYHLQKRMRKNRFNVCKRTSSSKSFTPTPSVKRTMRRCGDTDTFVVWEMFPGNDAAHSDSEEEEDFYFSDND